jgi:uncharacterized repeat protein (TIGR01451 family)
MKRSNLIDSMLCKYPSILIGLIIAAASIFPLAAPAMAAPNISISKASSSKFVMTGSDATYSITVSNTATGTPANDTAHKVNITDILPAGFKYKSQILPLGVTSSHTVGASSLSWNIATIPPNSSITISFTASTTGVPAMKYDNTATATFFKTAATALSGASQQTKSYSGASGTSEDVTIVEPSPNLTVTNTSPTGFIPVGENATYNITIENKGDAAAANVKVSDVLPSGFKYGTQIGSITTTGTAVASAVTNKPALGDTNLNWNISTIPIGSSITISFTASTVGVGKGKYDNSVNAEYYKTGSSTKKTASYDGTAGTAEDVTLTPLPSLTVDSSTLSGYIANGSTAIYQITVKNNSEGKAYNVEIADVLPAGFKYEKELLLSIEGEVLPSATKSYVKPGLNDPAPKWQNYDIPGNGSVTILFTATSSISPTATANQTFNNSVNVTYAKTPTGASTLNASFDGSTSLVDNVVVKPVPPKPTLGTAVRSATAESFTPETFCGGKPGSEGVATGTGGTSGLPGSTGITGIVNTYYQPALQSVTAGTRNINMMAVAAKGKVTKNDLPVSATNPVDIDIKPGDLLLIIQMQDATITNSNSDTYGSGNALYQGSGHSNMGKTGLYEYAIADSTVSSATGGGVLKLKKALMNDYVSSAPTTTSGQKRFQVVRVPQYASITVDGTLYATPWDGNVGGILAVDTYGKFNLNGQRMSVNSAGFRGGFGLQNGGLDAIDKLVELTSIYTMGADGKVQVDATTGAPISITNARTAGSGKGEGTAGTPRFISTQKLSDVDPNTGSPKWAGGALDNIVEGYPGGDTGRGAPANAGGAGNYHNAGGGGGGNGGIGGQGGLSWSSGTAFVPFDTGGRPGYLSSTFNPVPWQLIMGGGGGGGDANNSPQGVPGGAGGGIVMLRAGEIVGSGSIFANGREGDRGAYSGAPDGAGGAGAGGTVLIQSRNASSANLTIEAKGGSGGNSEQDGFIGATPHGPGGGGAGGVVMYNTPGSTINAIVTGGSAGNIDATGTNPQASTPHGATAGSNGIKIPFSNSEDPFNSLNNKTDCSPKLVMTNTAVTSTVRQGEIAKYTISVKNIGTIGTAEAVSIDNPVLPVGFTYLKTDKVDLQAGASRPKTSVPADSSTAPKWGEFTIPPGGVVEITYQVRVRSTVKVGKYDNSAHTSYPDPTRDESNPNAVIENNYDGTVTTETKDDITVTKGNAEMVWDLSPSIRIVRR